MRTPSLFLLALAVLCVPAIAAPPELVTDRPDATESTETVPRGWFQAELGVGDEDLGEVLGTGLLRIGLADRVELRLGADEGAPRTDFSIGAKMKLADERGEEVDLVVLDRALDRLREQAPRQAQVVELRYFGGLTVEETADVLGISMRMVSKHWHLARAWLGRELSPSDRP